MTISGVSRRTGVPVKVTRRDDLGLIYIAGRSLANYRLLDTASRGPCPTG
jgi:hypothetical protein